MAWFYELRVLHCNHWAPGAVLAPPTALAARHNSLPRLIKLYVSNCVLNQTFGRAGPLRETLPNLQELSLTITRSDIMPAVSTILSEAPASLTTLKLPDNFGYGIPRGYLPANQFSPTCRLRFGGGT